MTEIYCSYCYITWRLKREYDRHLTCCEFFYQLRKHPERQMDDYGVKVPTQRDLFRFVQELALKCDRLDKEVGRLKTVVSTRQKKVITECLANPNQTPEKTFDAWWRTITVSETHLTRVFKEDLTEGMKSVLESQLKLYGKTRLPIRAFVEKPGMFYIYVRDSGETKTAPGWRLMSNADMETMLMYLSQLFLREFIKWQRENVNEIETNEDKKEQELMYMVKVNGMKTSTEKRVLEIKKWFFPIIEESLKTMDVEYV